MDQCSDENGPDHLLFFFFVLNKFCLFAQSDFSFPSPRCLQRTCSKSASRVPEILVFLPLHKTQILSSVCRCVTEKPPILIKTRCQINKYGSGVIGHNKMAAAWCNGNRSLRELDSSDDSRNPATRPPTYPGTMSTHPELSGSPNLPRSNIRKTHLEHRNQTRTHGIVMQLIIACARREESSRSTNSVAVGEDLSTHRSTSPRL